MSTVVTSANFEKEAKRLIKKYRSLGLELVNLIESLSNDPIQGISLGDNCYKIRLAIKSKQKGKSGGARVITCIVTARDEVNLLSIYDKSEQSDISDSDLKDLIKSIN